MFKKRSFPGYTVKRKWNRTTPLQRYIFYTCFLFLAFTIQGLWFINRTLEPTLIRVAESQTKKIASMAITNAIKEGMASKIDVDELIQVKTDEAGRVTSVDFSAAMINRVRADTTELIHENLVDIENGNMKNSLGTVQKSGIIYEIPIGRATNNILLATLGPNIPVTFSPIGDVVTDVKKTVEPYGINNVLIGISVDVEVEVQIIIPFATKITKVKSTVPVGLRLIEGEVPQYYGGGNQNAPSIALPMNPKK